MKSRYLSLIFLFCIGTGTLVSMDSQELIISDTMHESLYAEGKDVTIRFFSRRKSFSTRDHEMDQGELLATVLRHPEAEQGRLSFDQFKEFYRGVQDAFESLNREEILGEKVPLFDMLLQSCKAILTAGSYDQLILPSQQRRWANELPILVKLLASLMLVPQVPKPLLNKAAIAEFIAQGNAQALVAAISQLDTHLDEGTIMQEDCEWLFGVLSKVFGVPLSKEHFECDLDFEDYQRALLEFGKK